MFLHPEPYRLNFYRKYLLQVSGFFTLLQGFHNFLPAGFKYGLPQGVYPGIGPKYGVGGVILGGIHKSDVTHEGISEEKIFQIPYAFLILAAGAAGENAIFFPMRFAFFAKDLMAGAKEPAQTGLPMTIKS